MAYSAMQIANAFIDISRRTPERLPDLTPMKLQKLMFFAQSWYLKEHSLRLIDDTFYRWDYGPVIPSVYYEFRNSGGNPIKTLAKGSDGRDVRYRLTPRDEEFLQSIVRDYGAYNGWTLSQVTHQLNTAWSNGRIGTIITDWDMFDGKL